MTGTELLLALLFLAVATLYSSVGHAGASGYIAAMALLGFAPEQMRPTALALNLLVGGIGLYRFWRAGHVRWRNVLPFVPGSAPAAFLAAQVQLPKQGYSLLLGLLLLVAAAGVFHHAGRAEGEDRAAAGRRGDDDAVRAPALIRASRRRPPCAPGARAGCARRPTPARASRASRSRRPRCRSPSA